MSAGAVAEERRRLVDRYVDGLAEPAEIAELNRLLSADPATAAYFAKIGRLNCLLREHATESAAESAAEIAAAETAEADAPGPAPVRIPRPMSSRRAALSRRRAGSERRAAGSQRRAALSSRRLTRRRSGLVMYVAAAAAVVIAAGLWKFLPRGGERGTGPANPWTLTIVAFRGQPRVYRDADPVEVRGGASLLPGDRVLTDAGSVLSLEYGDGTRLDINRGGRLTLGSERFAKEMTLDSGDLYLSAAHQAAGWPLRVNPGRHDEVTVIGTRLEVSMAGSETVLRVAEGRAVLGRGERGVTVETAFAGRVGRDGLPGAPEPLRTEGIAAWRANRPPRARGARLEAVVGGTTAVKLVAEDPDGDHIEYRVEEGPEHGKLSGTAPDLSYEPEAGYLGEDWFSFAASDGSLAGESARISLTVKSANRPPRAVVVAQPQRGRAPLRVILGGMESSDPDGKIVSYVWDFGDGSRGEGLETAHVYQRPGTYTVKLTVRDDRGSVAESGGKVEVFDAGYLAAPARFRWHYHKEKGSYWSWQDNSEGEACFIIERAHDPTGRGGPNLVWEVIEETPANTTLLRIRYRKERQGEWYQYRVRAMGGSPAGRSEPSNSLRQKWGGEASAREQVNWPPPGYVEK